MLSDKRKAHRFDGAGLFFFVKGLLANNSLKQDFTRSKCSEDDDTHSGIQILCYSCSCISW
jgi:hypothetical protein